MVGMMAGQKVVRMVDWKVEMLDNSLVDYSVASLVDLMVEL